MAGDDEARKVSWNAATFIRIAAMTLENREILSRGLVARVSDELLACVEVHAEAADPAAAQSDAIVARLGELLQSGAITADDQRAIMQALMEAPRTARRLASNL